MRYILGALMLVSCFFSFSQNIDVASQTIEDLCSREFAGRGYLDSGDRFAADYIAKKFSSFNLKKFTKNYQHPVSLSVNTIPKSDVLIDGKELIPGLDYLISPSANSISGDYLIFYISPKILNAPKLVSKVKKAIKRGYVPVVPVYDSKNGELEKKIQTLRLISKNKPIVFLKKQLIWSVSTHQSNSTEIWMIDSSFNRFSKQIHMNVVSKFIPTYTTSNVIGYVEGTIIPDSFIILCGHYDHLGRMGEAVFYGANDNASGIAMLLDLASYFSRNPQKYSIAFVAFGAEEAGLLGSLAYVKQPQIPLNQTKFVFNMDLMGSGHEGATIVNGKIYTEYYEKLNQINTKMKYLPSLKARGKAANSDHYFFSEAGVPSFFIYLMGDYKYYHVPDDNPTHLKLGHYYTQSYLLISDFIMSLN